MPKRTAFTPSSRFSFFFFFNDTATTEIYTLSLHDALPIWVWIPEVMCARKSSAASVISAMRSEEHTSELQSLIDLVCRLLLEKKKHIQNTTTVGGYNERLLSPHAACAHL